MSSAKLAFIGGGNMAASLIGGLLEQGYSAQQITASDPAEESRQKLAAQFQVGVTDDNNRAVEDADVVILAVKPQVMQPVAEGLSECLRGSLAAKPLVISIAAGIPVAALQGWLGSDVPIIRCMPNTPALLRSGASGLFANPLVTPEQHALAEQILGAVGIVTWLEEERDVDAVTALSGSGPAYFFLLIEAMEQAGIKQGLDPDTARKLCLQTALGAARMAAESDVDPAELRRRVTSPGGTTEAAIKQFMAGDLPGLVQRAMDAAFERAGEMAARASMTASETTAPEKNTGKQAPDTQ